MCGIVGYVGKNPVLPALIDGLKRLEYRGYDSAGVALLSQNKLLVSKKKGKVNELEKIIEESKVDDINCQVGIAHTRWATHGEPSDLNAHPHFDCQNKIAVVHNGIIENYRALKKWLAEKGHVFRSETDTEVITHLIEEMASGSLLERVCCVLKELEGTYGLLIISADQPGEIIAVRNGSPVSIGLGDEENMVASDEAPFVGRLKQVIHLEDGQIARLTSNSYEVFDFSQQGVCPYIQEINLTLEQIEKGGYPHFMLKEIFEQPKSISDTMAGRLFIDKEINEYRVHLGGINNLKQLSKAPSIILTACGTSWHAALIGEILFEHLAGIPAEVKYASELISLDKSLFIPQSIGIAITQSGETKDTDLAIKALQARGVDVMGICNVAGSIIARRCGQGVYTHAGKEIGVASTKAFTAQLLTLLLMSLAAGQDNGMVKKIEEVKKNKASKSWFQRIAQNIRNLPQEMQKILDRASKIEDIAKIFYEANNFLFLGRGINFPIALEGALKLKEISYIHAEGYPAGEMKHGPIALIDENMPTVVIAPNNDMAYSLICSNIEEIKARKGKVIAIANEGDREISEIADYVFFIPKTSYFLLPLLTVIPLQLLAYYIAVLRGCNVDQPRNLAKAVTVP